MVMENRNPESEGQRGRVWTANELGPVVDALNGLRFGSVEIFIQDSKLVQIDRKEKIRTFK